MLVTREQLISYSINNNYWFSRRTGSGDPISRDQYFIDNPSELVASIYCAIGDDSNGWELEQFNGINWVVQLPDNSYNLVVTTEGLKKLASVQKGGLSLTFSGIKMLKNTVLSPATPFVNWTDTDFLQAGEVVFSVGTVGSPNLYVTANNPYGYTDYGDPYLKYILSWKINSATGALQYQLLLPPDGFGAFADNGAEEWSFGTIGLYIKNPDDGYTDVLFAVASLPKEVTKYATSVSRIGNALKLYFNTLLGNLAFVENLIIEEEEAHSLPEVPNESMIIYPQNAAKRPHNCYVIDNLYGTGIPALALPRKTNTEWYEDTEWSFIQPTDNFLNVEADNFASDVTNYMFVYWNATTGKYERAEGKSVLNEDGDVRTDLTPNTKMPIGIRVGNSIVYSGEITNNSTAYQYTVTLENNTPTGTGYAAGEELVIPAEQGLIFKLTVTSINGSGAIETFALKGPTVGNITIPNGKKVYNAEYDYRSQLPHSGQSAKFVVTSTATPNALWAFPSSWLNQPLYCDSETNAGRPTLTQTDSFLGWCTSSNSIRLALDLRNEASYTVYGTTRYATNDEVKEVYNNPDAQEQTAVTPKELRNNYLQTTRPGNSSQPGHDLSNPINVDTFVRFNNIVLGKGTSSTSPHVTDSNISFYGLAYRSYYGDIAEEYESDKLYLPGTLITFGKGLKEISEAVTECNGVISTNPGYILGEKKSQLHLPVALCGRVPVLMDGNCLPKFGDKIYLSKIKPGRASTVPNGKPLGKIIAHEIATNKPVECVIRIDF